MRTHSPNRDDTERSEVEEAMPSGNFSTPTIRTFGRLAQLVERFIYTEEAIGPSPIAPTKI